MRYIERLTGDRFLHREAIFLLSHRTDRSTVSSLHLQLILDGQAPLRAGLIEAACQGGVNSIQVRSRGLPVRRLLSLASSVIKICNESSRRPMVLVNDRVDVALLAGADGVHLPEQSFQPTSIPPLRELAASADSRRPIQRGTQRQRGTHFIVGRSIHGPDAAQTGGTEHLDYLLFGHVFDSASKPGIRPRGLYGLARTVRQAAVPVLAVGGITAETVPDVIGAGAKGIAVISEICAASDPYAATRSLREALDRCGISR